MSDEFFKRPILNSPYERPARHWELDQEGQPTQRIVETRREARYVTPIPKAKKQTAQAGLGVPRRPPRRASRAWSRLEAVS